MFVRWCWLFSGRPSKFCHQFEIPSLSFPPRSGRIWSRSVTRTTRRSCVVWFTATWPPHDRRCRAQTRPRWKIWMTCGKTSPSSATRWGTCSASGPPNMPCSIQGAKKETRYLFPFSLFSWQNLCFLFARDAVWPQACDKLCYFESQRHILNLELN